MNTAQPPVDHDRDIHAWATQNAEWLRQGRLGDIDTTHIAEELDSMGRSLRRELNSRLRVLLVHLLKWRHQPPRRGASWRLTIRNQRTEIRELLEESPSLKARLPDSFLRQYPEARELAALETELPATTFPTECPFTLDETLSSGYWPD